MYLDVRARIQFFPLEKGHRRDGPQAPIKETRPLSQRYLCKNFRPGAPMGVLQLRDHPAVNERHPFLLGLHSRFWTENIRDGVY